MTPQGFSDVIVRAGILRGDRCALCGAMHPTIPSGLAPAWCGYDLGPEYDRKGDQVELLCQCTGRQSDHHEFAKDSGEKGTE